MEKNKVDFIGIGNAITDIQAVISENDLLKLNLPKGMMSLINYETYVKLETTFRSKEVKLSGGGSVANTTYALRKLGATCAFAGQLGNDDQGDFYTKDLSRVGIQNLVHPTEGRSGACVVLITPDAQRTLNTYLGVSVELKQLRGQLPNCKYFMVEGYLFDCPDVLNLLKKLIPELKSKGTKIILSCSDPFCVDRHRESFLNFIQKYCDIVICNELEIEHLLGSSQREFIQSNSYELCDLFVVTRGPQGSEYYGPNFEFGFMPAEKVKAIDTTGAGDYFAAGFIRGLLSDLNYSQCLNLGNVTASQVIKVYGARLEDIRI